MNKFRVMYLICILLGAASLASGQTMSKCFSSEWLQGRRTINLEINGNRVSGTFAVTGGETASDATYNFSGTMSGNALTVAFANNKLPDVAPSEMKSLVWTLVQRGGKESLRIKFYGKNYQTNKYEDSFAYFESCEASASGASASDAKPSYADLAKTAQTIRFARGASSASVRLDSLTGAQGTEATATFFVNAARSQSLDIKAYGCSVQVYLPNKKIYEYVEWQSEDGSEKTYGDIQMDMMTIESLPASGNYLIVLRKLTADSTPDTLTVTVAR